MGLIVLWIVGLSTPVIRSAAWMVWMIGVAGLVAFVLSGTSQLVESRERRAAGPLAVSLELFALWILGMSLGVAMWLDWWTFAFACAFLVLGFLAAAYRPRARTEPEVGRQQFRRTG
jgi:hypothetical protein